MSRFSRPQTSTSTASSGSGSQHPEHQQSGESNPGSSLGPDTAARLFPAHRPTCCSRSNAPCPFTLNSFPCPVPNLPFATPFFFLGRPSPTGSRGWGAVHSKSQFEGPGFGAVRGFGMGGVQGHPPQCSGTGQVAGAPCIPPHHSTTHHRIRIC